MRLRLLAGLGVLLVALVLAATVSAQDPVPQPGPPITTAPPLFPPAPGELVVWRRSKAVGKPWRGRLVRGVKLPSYGADWFTYDWGTHSSPNRIWRRYGHERMVRMLLRVVGEYRLAHPEAPRVGIADLSRPQGRLVRPPLRRAGPRLAPERPRRRRALPAAGRPGDGARTGAPDQPRRSPRTW